DYAQAIDAEMWAYIEKVTGWFPPESSGLPIDRQRAIYNAMCRHFHAGRPPNVCVHDEPIDGPGGTLTLRLYRRADAEASARVLFFHGGGFVLGDLDSHDDICA